MRHEITPPRRGRKRERTFSPGLELAIEAAGGTAAGLARVVGISSQAVSVWTEVPIAHVIPIEQALKVPRELLRPDYFDRNYRNGGARKPRQKTRHKPAARRKSRR